MPPVSYLICPDCEVKNLPGRSHCLGCGRLLADVVVTPAPDSGASTGLPPLPDATQAGSVGYGSEIDVVRWYRAYCFLFLVLFLIVAPLMILASPLLEPPWWRTLADLLCVICAIPFGIALILRPTPGAWIYHIVIICIGMGGCTLPVSVILLILWFRPETEAYFGRGKSA